MNEGWLNNTHSSRHFQMISQIRAIEQRKSVIATSKGGISSIIAASGEIIVEETSKSPSVLQGKLELNKKRTFYSQFGNIILKYLPNYAAFYEYAQCIAMQQAFDKIVKPSLDKLTNSFKQLH